MRAEEIIASPEMRARLGWQERHTMTAAAILKEYGLKLPRDRELIRQLTLLRIQQGTGVKPNFIPSWDDPDA